MCTLEHYVKYAHGRTRHEMLSLKECLSGSLLRAAIGMSVTHDSVSRGVPWPYLAAIDVMTNTLSNYYKGRLTNTSNAAVNGTKPYS